jgi:hypothetical protein
MGYRVRCDWCGCDLRHGEFAELPVSIKRRRTSALDSKWAEEVRPTLHLCVNANQGHERMGITLPDDTDACYERAIAAITGTTTEQPDMGMEWRLVPIGATVHPPPKAGAEAAPDLAEILSHLPPQFRYALPEAGISTLAQLDAMTDSQLLAIKGIGPTVVARLRAARDMKKST